MNEVTIVGLGGSMAQTTCSSSNALRTSLAAARQLGARTELLTVSDLNLPIYVEGQSTVPEAAERLVAAIRRAHGLIWASPLYHGTVSGAFKNTIDWLQLLSRDKPPYLTNKVVGLISAAGGVQGLQAINTMEYMVRSLRGWTVPYVLPIARAWQAFDESGAPREAALAKQLQQLAAEVVTGARRFNGIPVDA